MPSGAGRCSLCFRPCRSQSGSPHRVPILSGSSVVAFVIIALELIIERKWAELAAETGPEAKELVPSLVAALQLVVATFQVNSFLIF